MPNAPRELLAQMEMDADATFADTQRISDAVGTLRGLDEELAAADAEVKRVKEQIQECERRTIPDLMTGAGVEKVVLEGGQELSLRARWEGHISAAQEEDAFRWLRAHGHGGLIKNQISVSLGPQEEQRAAGLLALLEKHGYASESKQTVHAATLKSWLKEMFSKPDIPEEQLPPRKLFGVFDWVEAHIPGRSKRKKSKKSER